VTDDTPARFVALVKRELGAVDVVFREADDPPRDGTVSASLPDGRFVEVELQVLPDDAEALSRRLEMLVGAFEGLTQSLAQKRREPPAVLLKKELRSLVKRSSAAAAMVIDAKSPVVWASAGADDDGESDAGKAATTLRERAIGELRGLPQMGALHRGGHLALTVREDTFGYVVRSFAGIYVLCVVFDHAFDEIKAERALRESLPRVERLVLALPPLDPEPVPAGVVALRPRRRRLR
jgi:hypothetical protein